MATHMGFGKWFFMCCKASELNELLTKLNQKSQELKLRGESDRYIRKLRNSYFVLEMLFYLVSFATSVIFLTCTFIQIFFDSPRQLLIPMDNYFTKNYFFLVFITQFGIVLYEVLLLLSSSLLVGNLYNQIILHLNVLYYDWQQLDNEDLESSEEFIKQINQLIREYQEIVHIKTLCETCIRPLILNDGVASTVTAAVSCIEFVIVINDDWRAGMRPVMTFIYINCMFFYWCWLGNRLEEKVGISQ